MDHPTRGWLEGEGPAAAGVLLADAALAPASPRALLAACCGFRRLRRLPQLAWQLVQPGQASQRTVVSAGAGASSAVAGSGRGAAQRCRCGGGCCGDDGARANGRAAHALLPYPLVVAFSPAAATAKTAARRRLAPLRLGKPAPAFQPSQDAVGASLRRRRATSWRGPAGVVHAALRRRQLLVGCW